MLDIRFKRVKYNEGVRAVRPDVVLMVLGAPDMSGIEATRIFHNDLPEVRVIGLSAFDDAERAAAMREAGARDYLTKSCPPGQVLAAIHSAGTGVS